MGEKPKKKTGEKSKQNALFSMLDISEKEPATDLMKAVAKKVPQRRKIVKDFSSEEAKEIFKDIEKSRTKKVASEKNDGQKEELEETQRELIYRIKHTVKKMEQGNKSKVIVFPSYSRNSEELRWYKLADFSAYYYAYRMAERMGKADTPRLKDDKDRFARMHKTASISNIDDFVSKAMRLNEIDRHDVTLDGIHILYLKKGLTDDELILLRRTEEMRKENMHNILRPKKASPEMYLTIMTLGRQIIKMTEGLPRHCRYGIGDRITENAVNLLSVYYDYAMGFTEVTMVKRTMQKIVNSVRATMSFLGESEIIHPVKACAIGDTIEKIEGLIKGLK